MIEIALDGGINTGVSPWKLAEGEFISLQNFFPFGLANQPGVLRRRGGIRRINSFSNRYDFALRFGSVGSFTGLLNFRPFDRDPFIIVPTQFDEWIRFDGTNFDVLPNTTAVSISASLLPWTMFQYKGIGYGIRENAGAMLRCNGNFVGVAGIEAPTTAPTLADGGSGDIPDADFIGVVVFLNTDTDARSNPSPESAVVTLAGGGSFISWSGIPVSSNPQVNARELYRSLPDGSGEFYKVATIENNVDTTYTPDNVLPEDMGDLASFNNGLPDGDFKFAALWKERVYASNGRDLRYSEIGNAEGFGDDNELAVRPDDNQDITGLCEFGENLLIGKTGSMHYLTPGDIAGLPHVLSDRAGCASHFSIKSIDNQAIWLGPDDVYRTDGVTVIGIGNVKIKTFLDALDPEDFPFVQAAVLPSRNLYILYLPGDDPVYLVYNYVRNTWSTITSEDALPNILAEYTTEDGERRVYGTMGGNIVHLLDESRGWDDAIDADEENDIPGYFETGPIVRDAPGFQSVIRRLWVFSEAYPAQFTAQFRRERDLSLTTGRTMSLNVPTSWKPYALAMFSSASEVRLAVTYTGRSLWVIEGLGLDTFSMARRRMAT